MNNTSSWQDVEVLIAVKAYPHGGETGRETCCTAGITNEGRWLRLYPIYYTMLPDHQRYKKYDVVRMKIRKLKTDPRPESMEVLHDSIQIVRWIGPEHNWRERSSWVEKAVDASMCEIARQQQATGKSMGAFRPAMVLDVELTERKRKRGSDHRMVQLNLLDPQWRPIPPVPYSIKLSYRCSHPGCAGHVHTIVDWEASQLFWRLQRRGLPLKSIRCEIRSKILDHIFSPRNDTIVFCGNIKVKPTLFVIGGFFYHKLQHQRTLFS